MMTLTALAKLAHVSVATASKAFTMSREVHPETRELIFRIAREHNCFRTFFKARYPKLTVGIICDELQSRYYAMLLELIQQALSAQNCEIITANTQFSPDRAAGSLVYFEDYTSVDAVIVIGSPALPAAHHEIPLIAVHSTPEGADLCLTVDYTAVLVDLVGRFRARGIRRIGFIGEPRTHAKRDALRAILFAGDGDFREEWMVESGERFEAGGYAGMEELLRLPERPEAVICAYDYMAYGALRCAADRGIRVPEDMQILGMDNLPESAYHIPRLSSIDLCSGAIARLVGDNLRPLLEGADVPASARLEAAFIGRDSTTV